MGMRAVLLARLRRMLPAAAAGSGTTGVVALREGRAFLRFELFGGDVDHGGWTPQDRFDAAKAGRPEPFGLTSAVRG